MTAYCPALFIAAPSSGQGKTTFTAALARLFARQGKAVRVFKTGPDYLDPQVLAQASGHPVESLDIWMAGKEDCRRRLYEAAQEADLILVEGAMGLFDGEPSSADLAAAFEIPIALLMDVKGMAQTAAAIAVGLANYRSDIVVAGLIANNCGSARHAMLIKESLPETLPLLAALNRDDAIALPERHLGLVQPSEIEDELHIRLERGADWLAENGLTDLPSPVCFQSPRSAKPVIEPLLDGKTIAIAKDPAFTFAYQANIDLLLSLGAQITYFSPLTDKDLPQADGLWLPGGYPELHAKALSENTSMSRAIQRFHERNLPILAECGGFLYLLESLNNLDGERYPMLGLISGQGHMRDKGGCQGMQTAILSGGRVRAHAHHRSRYEGDATAYSFGERQRHPAPGEPVYQFGKLIATYLHLYFPSNPRAIADMFL